MPTSYTPSLRLWEGQPGDPTIRNAWGTFLNTNDQLVEAAILGNATVNIAGLTTYALTTANGAADQARPIVQIFTGALTANCTVTLPNVLKFGMAINQTTGGFNVILTSGGGTTVTVPPENLPYDYFCDGAGNVTVYQRQPGPRFGDWKFNSMAAEGGGWRLAYGQTRPRTDPLWQWLTAQGISWPHGNGDGSTTYTMPDFRGNSWSGVDNQGGTAANRITSAGSGIAGTTPGATGGNQLLQAHTHTVSITDPGHTHSHTDPGHTHSHSDPGHVHGVSDPGHLHSVSDPGHVHSFLMETGGGAPSGIPTSAGGSTTGNGSTLGANTGVTIQSSGTGIGINGAFTGITNVANTTGITNVANTTGITATGTSTGGGSSEHAANHDGVRLHLRRGVIHAVPHNTIATWRERRSDAGPEYRAVRHSKPDPVLLGVDPEARWVGAHVTHAFGWHMPRT